MEYKLIALDMDGTLLNSELDIDKETLLSIEKAKQSDKYVVVASGRSLIEVQPYIEKMKDFQYFILENGAVIYDCQKRKIVSRQCFHPLDIQYAYQAILKHDVFVIVCVNGCSYVVESQIENCEDYQLGVFKEAFQKITPHIKDLKEFLDVNQENIEKLSYYCKDSKEVQLIKQTLKDVDIEKAEVGPCSLETTPKKVNKASGLIQLCQFLQVPLLETMAVGDSDNDIEIFKIVGLPISMANGNDNVKSLAKVIVSDNDHQGVKEAIEKYLL